MNLLEVILTDDDKKRFATQMIGCGEVYSKEVTKTMMQIYFSSLKNFDIDDVEKAFQSHIKDTDNGQFMPKPADIIRHIEGSKEGRSMLAWSKVVKAIRSYGSRNSVVFDDEIIHSAITQMGGWHSVQGWTEDELKFKANVFDKIYRSAMLTGVGEFEPVMIGSDDIRNMASGYLKFEDIKPSLCGEKRKCLLVFKSESIKNKEALRIEL